VFIQGDTTLYITLIKPASGGGFSKSHVPMQYVQSNAAGLYDPNQQQLFVPQQMQQLKQENFYIHGTMHR
jgi:hypothetical protein